MAQGVRFSRYDDIPSVFFSETLLGVQFMYGGEKYNSVKDCFNSRKISKSHWFPELVPEQQRVNMISYAFLKPYIEYTDIVPVIKIGDDAQVSHFEYAVCAMLFVQYFEQVFNNPIDVTIDFNIARSKYEKAYYACKKLWEFAVDNEIVQDIDMLLLGYKIPVELTDYSYYSVIVNVGKECTSDINMDILPSWNKVYIDYTTCKNILKAGQSVFNKMVQSRLVEIYCTQEQFEDYTLTLLQDRYKNRVKVVVDDLNYYDNYVISFGSLSDSKCKLVDWDKVYIVR